MPRQVRIEYEGARYHVMARGDRREPIVYDDSDRRALLENRIESQFLKHHEKERGRSGV